MRIMKLSVIVTIALFPSIAHSEMTFRLARTGGNCATCEWVAADGEITENTPEDFLKFLNENRPVRDLVINSPGGDLAAGMNLGRIFRMQGINTIVGRTITGGDPEFPKYSTITEGYCFSACSYAFLGGVNRHVNSPDFGVHQFYSAGGSEISSSEAQSIMGVAMTYFSQMGVRSEALISASMTPPDQIYAYSDWELESFGIDNTPRAIDNGWFPWLLGPKLSGELAPDPHWMLAPYQDGLMLSGSVLFGARRSVSVTIFCRKGGPPANLLIQERSEVSNSVDVLGVEKPLLTVAGTTYQLNRRDIDFQGLDRGTAMISLNLPSEILLDGAYKIIEFDPQLSRAVSPLLALSVRMPSEELMASVFRNCIKVR